jgi:uncharacterized protein YpmB
MDFFWNYFHTHQFAVIAVITVALLTLYFLFKNLIKLALIFLIILVLVGSYFYLTAPKRSPEDITKALKQAKDQTEMAVEKGKNAYQTGKNAVEKGKQLTDDISKVLNKDKEEPPKKP